MKSDRKPFRLLLALSSIALFAGCATGPNSSYKQGVAGNVVNYREFSTLMHSQQNTLTSCFNAAGASRDASALSLCAVLAAGTNAQQTLAGQPAAIRVAKSPEEIQEAILSGGMDMAVKMFGLKQVAEVMKSGFSAAAKDPVVEIVRPEVVNPVVVQPTIVQVPLGSD